MLKVIKSAAVLGTLLGIALTVGPGCGKKPPEEPAKDVGKLPPQLLALQADMAAAKTQIGVVASTLDAMTANADIDPRPYFKQFSDAVAALNKQAATLRAHRDTVEATETEYFAKRETELAKVSTPEVKKRFTERRDDLLKARAAVKESVKAASEAAAPYLSDLEDLKKIIDADPNAANIKGLAETFKKIKEKGDTVGKLLDDLAGKLSGISAMYSPGA